MTDTEGAFVPAVGSCGGGGPGFVEILPLDITTGGVYSLPALFVSGRVDVDGISALELRYPDGSAEPNIALDQDFFFAFVTQSSDGTAAGELIGRDSDGRIFTRTPFTIARPPSSAETEPPANQPFGIGPPDVTLPSEWSSWTLHPPTGVFPNASLQITSTPEVSPPQGDPAESPSGDNVLIILLPTGLSTRDTGEDAITPDKLTTGGIPAGRSEAQLSFCRRGGCYLVTAQFGTTDPSARLLEQVNAALGSIGPMDVAQR